MTHKVFVYGTLRNGWGNHALLVKSEFLGKATLQAKMYTFGFIPYISLNNANDDDIVHGEVYSIDDYTLARLDQLEGYREGNVESSFYTRSLVRTSLGDAYVYHIEYRDNNEAKRIESGDWSHGR
jgi:gamma-glutamylcyclotransferase (GGCT)/AIG2-like uncharacterized protein YtfP